jgi:hypothetical protein
MNAKFSLEKVPENVGYFCYFFKNRSKDAELCSIWNRKVILKYFRRNDLAKKWRFLIKLQLIFAKV